MIIAAFFGWSAVIWFGASANVLFQIVALAALAYGVLTAPAVLQRRMFLPEREPTGHATRQMIGVQICGLQSVDVSVTIHASASQ